MDHDSYPDSYIRGILNTVKTIAMVGASEKQNRPSYFAFKYLLERGYTMIPVNPGHAAKFATPGVNIGLFCSTPMVALSRNVSRKHAMEMLLTGELIAAEAAARIGLVNHVVADGHERNEAIKLAEKIAAKSALVVKIGKEAFYRQAEMPLAEAYKYAAEVMVENMLFRDAEEGIGAFIAKREPKWQDR